jgi:hypothetical protein
MTLLFFDSPVCSGTSLRWRLQGCPLTKPTKNFLLTGLLCGIPLRTWFP